MERIPGIKKFVLENTRRKGGMSAPKITARIQQQIIRKLQQRKRYCHEMNFSSKI